MKIPIYQLFWSSSAGSYKWDRMENMPSFFGSIFHFNLTHGWIHIAQFPVSKSRPRWRNRTCWCSKCKHTHTDTYIILYCIYIYNNTLGVSVENDGHAAQSPTISTINSPVPTSHNQPHQRHQHSHVSFSESFKLKHTVVFFWVSSLLSESSPRAWVFSGLAKEKIPQNEVDVNRCRHLRLGDFNQQHDGSSLVLNNSSW